MNINKTVTGAVLTTAALFINVALSHLNKSIKLEDPALLTNATQKDSGENSLNASPLYSIQLPSQPPSFSSKIDHPTTNTQPKKSLTAHQPDSKSTKTPNPATQLISLNTNSPKLILQSPNEYYFKYFTVEDYGDLALTYQQESIDYNWAYDEEQRLISNYYTNAPSVTTTLEKVKCKTSICIMSLQLHIKSTEIVKIPEKWYGNMDSSSIFESEDGDRELLVVFKRNKANPTHSP